MYLIPPVLERVISDFVFQSSALDRDVSCSIPKLASWGFNSSVSENHTCTTFQVLSRAVLLFFFWTFLFLYPLSIYITFSVDLVKVVDLDRPHCIFGDAWSRKHFITSLGYIDVVCKCLGIRDKRAACSVVWGSLNRWYHHLVCG